VLRTHRESAKAQPYQLLAHSLLMHLDTETRLDLALQVNVAPAHHPVRRRVRTLAYHLRQLSFLLNAQQRRRPSPATVRQPLQPFGVEAVNPIAQRLPVHAAGLGSAPAGHPLQHHAIASIRRAAFESFTFDAASLSSRADMSVRVIATAIETSIFRSQ
jgi:hypothetical protein